MSTDRFLIWDFDGTLAFRSGNWTGALCEVVAAARPDLRFTPECFKPYLQSGFPWHTPEVIRGPCSAEQWWNELLLPVLVRALQSAAGLTELEAQRVVAGMRAAYTDAKHWHVFDDAKLALGELLDSGWRHIVLSNHVPELAELIEALGLSEFMAAVYSSAWTGVEKPHPKAFETVFARYPGARAGWVIGDSWRADVQGAHAVGMRAILARSKHPEARVQCDTLRDIVRLVEGKVLD